MIQEIGLIGKKIGMTREFYKSGQSVPVTAVKLGFINLKSSKLTNQMKGFFAKKNTEPKR